MCSAFAPSGLAVARLCVRSLQALVVLVAALAVGLTASVTFANATPQLTAASTGRQAAGGAFGEQTWHAVVALQGWSGLVRDGIAGPLTRRSLAHARRPVPWSTAPGFEIRIAQQVLLLVRDGRVERAIHVSTCRPGWPTPVGHFTIR